MADRGASGMLFWTAVGVAIGLLIAPRPGKENRKVVQERARTLWYQGKHWIETRPRGNGHREHIAEEELESRLVE
ncbi:MAG: YtxH domain-containing protein [Chloroflexi bacterium]|nr:YtxH domain-containing protein [Chloroflexota bacterium]